MTVIELLTKLARPYLEEWERTLEHRYARHLRLEAWKKRDHWRKADIPRLQKLGVQRSAESFLQQASSRTRGRGVVPPPTTLWEVVAPKIKALQTLTDPKTPSHIRRRVYRGTKWFPYLVEAAYRGELKTARALHLDKSTPHLPPHEIAEQNVAAAAGISRAKVRELCDYVRKAHRGMPTDEAPTSAEELKRHLEYGLSNLANEGRK